VVGLSLGGEPRLAGAAFELDRERALQGETVEATLILRAEEPVGRLEVLLDLPEGLAAEERNPQALVLGWSERRELEYTVRCERWGGCALGHVVLRSPDVFGLLAHEWSLERRVPLKVYPRGEAVRRLLRPLETQAFAGNQVPRARGEGIEFADLRPFVPGDR